MEKQVIQERLKNCPGMIYYPDNNNLEIIGRSISENPEKMYQRLDDWISTYFSTSQVLNVIIQLEYINSGSSRHIREILKSLTGYIRSGKLIKIKWFYEKDDDAMLELGEYYRDTSGIPLEIELVE